MAENIETGPPNTGNREELGEKDQTELPKKSENRKNHRSRGTRGRNPRMDVQYRDSYESYHRHGGYDDRYYNHTRSHGSQRGRGYYYKRSGSGRQHKIKQEANSLSSTTTIDSPQPSNETQGIEGKEQLKENSQNESKQQRPKTTSATTDPKESVVVIKHANRRPPKPRYDITDETHHRTNRRGNYYKKRDTTTIPPATLQSSELAQHLTAGTYECMICCEKVKSRHEIWGCPCCYHLFHLRCISRWARSPAAAVNEGNHEEGWRCPGCQNSSVVVPSVYKCFCGRVTDPGKRRGRGDMTVPHSCGELCSKKLATLENDGCHHKCHQLCHPGPCPPCPVTVLRYCPCGKSSSRVRCSQFKMLPSCGEVCGKKLNCGVHYCQQTCHEGECLSCVVDFEIDCFCKREKKSFKCGEISVDSSISKNGYSCKGMCKKLLSCGNHTCEEACHIGDCPPCALLPSAVTHCPCGATPINRLLPDGTSRTSCLDNIPTCNNQCLKPQPCSTKDSIHLCQAMCHVSDCPPCTSMSLAVCRCGRSTLKVTCTEVQDKTGFTCNRVCRKPMSCGRHKCQTKCCVSDDHECRRVCGRKFSCGLHTCPDICHPHGCGQCWNISYEELTCHCGKEVLLPPIHCGTTPPACSGPCARPHPCDHPITHICHNDEACPPCTFLTEKLCMGGHTTRKSIPCYLKDISCGMPCGKPLPCDMHSCRKTCHKGACQSEGEVCKQPCTRERRYCSHPCSAPCHPGNDCPETACNAKVELKCACGYRTENTLCLASSTDVMTVAFQKLHQRDFGSLLRELQSGHSVQVDSISLQNIKERRLDCNEECAMFERNRKLAEALDISDADFSPSISPQYSCYLLEQAREHKEFIESVEASLKQLVTTAQQSYCNETTCKHSFKPMKKNQRHVIHELAPYYGCTTASYDPEPLRSVVVMATNKSFVPAVLLSRSSNIGGEISGKVRLMPPPVAMKLPPTTSNRLSPELQSQSKTVPDYFNDENL